MGYWYLVFAIASEVVATLALKESDGFSRLMPNIVCVTGYAITFYLLSLAFKTVPVGIAYAIWAGMGIVLVTTISAFVFKQIPDLAALIGMFLILVGVMVINLFSKTSVH